MTTEQKSLIILQEELRYWRGILKSSNFNSESFKQALFIVAEIECEIKSRNKAIEKFRSTTYIGNYQAALESVKSQKRYMFGGLVGDKPSLIYRLYFFFKAILTGGKI